MMRQMQQTTNMLLAGFMKMNPNLLQAFPATTLSPPLMLGSVASKSLLNKSSTQEVEVAQLPQHEVNVPIPPTVVRRGIQDDTSTSLAMHPSSTKVTRSEAASVVVGVRNNNKRKESTRVKEVCSNCQFFWLSRCIST